MAQRGVSLRYLAAKFTAGAEEFANQLQSSAHGSITEAMAKAMERFQKQMTSVGVLTGVAMSPTLNSAGLKEPEAMERFLVRLIPRPVANKTVFDGDVVAFNSPLRGPTATDHVMVRRIAALEGDEMVSDDPEDEAFSIPKEHAWVLADNHTLEPKDAIDSRTFGPLPLRNVIGRVVYAAKSASDHGFVENSEFAMEADAPVLEAELDMGRLFPASAQSGDATENDKAHSRGDKKDS